MSDKADVHSLLIKILSSFLVIFAVAPFFMYSVTKRISAEAEAEANRKIAESLTPELNEKIKIEQWNGDVPQVQGNGVPILNLE